MSEKRTIVLLASIILIFSSVFAFTFADEAVIREKTYAENMTINGISLKDHIVKNKALVYNDYIYLPMDKEMTKILGVKCGMDEEKKVFTIEKSTIRDAGLKKVKQGAENDRIIPEDVVLVPGFDIDVMVTKTSEGEEGQPGRVSMYLDLTGKPVLKKDDIVYVPVSSIVASGIFGWSVGYDSGLGYFISSDKNQAAEIYLDAARLEAEQLEQEKSEKFASVEEYSGMIHPEKLTLYIQSVNPNVSWEDAQAMAVDSIYYGSMYGVDPLLIMSVMKCESTYYSDITNAAGTCIGLMQVNFNTAEPYGISREQLFRIDYNICCGSQVLRDYLARFDNDLLLGLTAYNCGPAVASGGRYAEDYYNKVVETYNSIAAFIQQE